MASDLEWVGQGFAWPYKHHTETLQAVQVPPFAPENPPLHTHA